MKRRIISLCLVLALVACMAMPAFAYRYGSGVKTVNGTPYMYSYNASYTSKQANCSMLYDYVSSEIECKITAEITTSTGSVYSNSRSCPGYGSVSVSASNISSNTATPISGTVTGYDAEFYISRTKIAVLSE